MPKKITETTEPAETTPVVETPVPMLYEKNYPKGPALVRVNVRVLAEDGETLLRTEVCDVYWESTLSYTEAQLSELGGSAEAARKLVRNGLLSPWSPFSDTAVPEAFTPIPTPDIKAIQRQAIKVPVPGESISLGDARRRDLGNENSASRSGKRKEPAEAPKRPKPISTPFSPPTK